jgi:predicted esterase
MIMKINILAVMTMVCLLMSSSFSITQEKNVERKIFQTDSKIKVDGNLEEWNGIEEIPVVIGPDGKSVEPSSDLAVTAKFTFSSKKFYAAVMVKDDEIEFPNRNRPNGDGFYLVFLDPYKGEQSDRFHIFGFSGEKGNVIRTLLNKDGEYFPGVQIKDIEMATDKKDKKGTVTFELSIPWEIILPFKPFFYEQWGLNLIYDDYDRGARKSLILLHPDDIYNIPAGQSRKGEVFQFVKHTPQVPEFQSTFNATHFFDDDKKELTIAVNSPTDAENWKIRYELSSGRKNVSSTEALSFKKGMNFIKKQVEGEASSSGFHDLSYAIISDKGALKYVADHGYFVLSREDFMKSYTQLEKAKAFEFSEEKEPEKEQEKQQEQEQEKEQKKDIDKETFMASLPTYEIRLDWIKDYMETAHPFADVRRLSEWFEELKTLTRNIEEGKPALFPTGNISQLAHRSLIDGSLQPFSVFIPPTYTGRSSLPLFVTLHASGMDERSSMMFTLRSVYRRGNFIVLAPRGRGLSDWYTGESGEDVIECINHVKKLYKIDERNIILDGFAMGGYGAYRLSLLYPDMFRAAIVRSGAIVPPSGIDGENILDLLDKGKNTNYYIVHGDKDEMISVDNARRVSQKMTELGIAHEYDEVKNADHRGYSKWHSIFRWLNKIIDFDTSSPERPPRKK